MTEPTVIRDQIYSFEIARRAVGRAALHLGIDSMTEQALDVLADVLLQYLSRTGKAMAHLVEASRRSSTHVNVLDAFRGCQLITSPAVGRLHLHDPEEEEDLIATPATPKASNTGASEDVNGNSGSPTPGGSPVASVPSNGGYPQPSPAPPLSSDPSSTGWKGLAAFVFGPKWLHEKDEDEVLQELAAKNEADASNGEGRELSSGAGGKAFPSIGDGVNGGVGDIEGQKPKRKKGWDAPFLDEVPEFPRASATCANPHALPARVTGGLTSAPTVYRKVDVDAEEAEEDEEEFLAELEALPDDAFLTPQESNLASAGDSVWGSIDGRDKRKLEAAATAGKDEDGDVEMQPATKKVKFGGSNAAKGDTDARKEAGKAISDGHQENRFLYIPTFYPRPSSTKVVVDERRTVVDDTDDRQQRLLQQQRSQQQQEQQVLASETPIENLDDASTSLRDTINITSSRGIRSSLIRLGNNNTSYWGSGWDQSSSSSTQTLAVPMGRKVAAPKSSGGQASAPEDPIVPMGRASGSRISRVLEGSMDAAAMQ